MELFKSELIFILEVSVGCSLAMAGVRSIELILRWLSQKSEILNTKLDDDILLLLKEYEEKKVIKLLKKDDFDSKNGHFVETGFMSPEEYYRLKEMYRNGFLD